MKVVGIVSEFNPFHNGHKYLIDQVKNELKPDYIVTIMSANFVQRGEPAIISKWARAEAALANGIDLVIELPSFFSIRSAESFAYSAVEALSSLGVITHLAFGSENNDLEMMNELVKFMTSNPAFEENLLAGLKQGSSYSVARLNAIPETYHYLLNSSNNILSIEYLKALSQLNSNIIPYSVKRQGSPYNNSELDGTFSSATSIRKSFDKVEALKATMPSNALDIYKNELSKGSFVNLFKNFGEHLFQKIKLLDDDAILKYAYTSDDLGKRLLNEAKRSENLHELIEKAVNKRHPMTRVQRALLSILLNNYAQHLDIQTLPYIKILGFKKNSAPLLKKIRESCTKTVSEKPIIFNHSENELIRLVSSFEERTTDLYTSCFKSGNHGGQELSHPPVIR